jgi:hypothetical protein
MNQQLAMFQRISHGVMTPNKHGLFDIEQLAYLAIKRDCKLIDAGDYSCTIRHPGKLTTEWTDVNIVAHDRGLWHPINIFRACRQAASQPSYTIDHAKAKIKNPNNLDEVRIASIIGADGVRPYLSRPSQYWANEEYTLCVPKT